MDVFDIIMDFLIQNNFEPSDALKEKYRNSKLNKILNKLPSREELNNLFKEKHINEKAYRLLKDRFKSRKPFIFYFNPKFDIIERFGKGWYALGFFGAGTPYEETIQIGAGMFISNNGRMYRGYYKEDAKHYYGRLIDEKGDIYEGGYSINNMCGQGMIEYYKDMTKEYGNWIVKEGKGSVRHGKFTYELDHGAKIEREYIKGEIISKDIVEKQNDNEN